MVEAKYNRVNEIITERSTGAGSKRKVGKSGYKGVTIDKRYGSYVAHFIISDGKSKRININLGSYSTAEEAHIARIKFIDSLK
jgi:hypothetical protein